MLGRDSVCALFNSEFKDEARSFFAGVPEFCDFAKWCGLDVEAKRIFGGYGEKFCDGLTYLLERCAAEAAAQQLKPGATQCCRGQGRLERHAPGRARSALSRA